MKDWITENKLAIISLALIAITSIAVMQDAKDVALATVSGLVGYLSGNLAAEKKEG